MRIFALVLGCFLYYAKAQGCNYANADAGRNPGFSRVCLQSQRCYLMYVPPNAESGGSSLPLVIDFHGSGACGAGSATYTGWKETADSEKFVVVYPQAVNNWIPFDGPSGDVGYVREIIQNVLRDPVLMVDSSRIYLAGHSAGCSMAQNMAAMASDIVAGVACHSLFLSSTPPQSYTPVPVMEIHGTQDFVPYSGAEQNFQKWKQINGCQGAFSTSNYDGFNVRTYEQCNSGAEVALVTVPGGQHNVYSVRNLYDTTQVAWNFLKRFTNLKPGSKPTDSGVTTGQVFSSLQVSKQSSACKDDPNDLISSVGLSCSLVVQILGSCNVDLSQRTPIVPAGTLLSSICPASCKSCAATSNSPVSWSPPGQPFPSYNYGSPFSTSAYQTTDNSNTVFSYRPQSFSSFGVPPTKSATTSYGGSYGPYYRPFTGQGLVQPAVHMHQGMHVQQGMQMGIQGRPAPMQFGMSRPVSRIPTRQEVQMGMPQMFNGRL